MMMRDVEAGKLCYKDYPRISYEGMEVCQNAYWWELYEYFHYCKHPEASFTQIMSFFVDCLGIQPSIALSCAFCSMGLERTDEATDAPYVIKRPPVPTSTPTVLLETVKRDERLSLVKSCSDYLDEDGHAVNHATYVKVFMRMLGEAGARFSADEISQLTDEGWCRRNLKIRRPLLKYANAQQERVRGYWLKKFDFGGESFYVCYGWNQSNKAAFDAWAVGKAKQAGLTFEPYEIGAADDDE